MAHTQDLTALALVLAAAVICGLFMNRLRLPAAAGFILAGVVLGPTGFGLVAPSASIETLAELGVLMLLFIIGMELRLQAFRALLPLAIGIAVAEILAAVAFTVALSQFATGETTSAVVIGFMLAISSTTIGMKMMEEAGEKTTVAGRLTIAVLVAQDLAVIPLLLVTNALGKDAADFAGWAVALRLGLALALLAAFIGVLTRVKSFRFPYSEFLLRDFDIGTLGVLGLCFAAAALSGLLGLSPALGAFLGGLAIGHSTLRRAALRMAGPVQSILLFTFFLSVGLLIDLSYVLRHLWLILIALAVVAAGKTFLNFAIIRLCGQPGDVAFRSALFLSPVGEFSFVLAAAGVTAGTLTAEGYKLAIIVIALSLMVSPLWFIGARRAHELALRGITGADALFRGSYSRELFFLGLWGRRVAAASGHAAAAASDLYREQKAKRAAAANPPDAAPSEPHEEPWGEIPTPVVNPSVRILPTAQASQHPPDPGE